jgi:hypothetical protein
MPDEQVGISPETYEKYADTFLVRQDALACERVHEMKVKAEADTSYNLTCIVGREKIFFVEHTRSLMPGHIYSYAGVREFRNTHLCEYHFDEACQSDPDAPRIGCLRNGEQPVECDGVCSKKVTEPTTVGPPVESSEPQGPGDS